MVSIKGKLTELRDRIQAHVDAFDHKGCCPCIKCTDLFIANFLKEGKEQPPSKKIPIVTFPYKCAICDTILNSWEELKRHALKHRE